MKMKPSSGPKKQTQSKPIQTQSKPVLSAFILSFVEVVEWANFFKGQNRLPENPVHFNKTKKNWTIPNEVVRIKFLDELSI